MYDPEGIKRYRATANGRAKVNAANKRWRDKHPELKPAFAAAKIISKQANPFRDIYNNKKNKAKRNNIPFSLVLADLSWPRFCPVLGMELDYSRCNKAGKATAASPSFDRKLQSGDYSPVNVLIVSTRANTLRGGDSPDELLDQARRKDSEDLHKVGTFYRALLKSENSHLHL